MIIPFPEVEGGFRTVFADPPWQYDDRINDKNRGAVNHYACMNLEELKDLPVASVTAPNAHLWLCYTNSFVEEAYQLARAWGFTPKTKTTWVKMTNDRSKVRIGMGHYLRNATEDVLFCTRGSLPPLVRNESNVIFAPRTEHSAKPEEMYQKVRNVSPGPRLEMFARDPHEGFISWGLEAR